MRINQRFGWQGMSAREWQEENLREKAARLQAILDTTVDGIITMNESGIVQSLQQSC